MDTRRFLTTVLIAAALYLLLTPLIRQWSGNNNNNNAAAPVASTLPYAILTNPAASEPASAPAATLAAASAPTATTAPAVAAPPTIRLGDPYGPTDKVAITVDPVTAGIDLVQLNIHDYAETVARKQPFTFMEWSPGTPRPFSTLSVSITAPGAAPIDYNLYGTQAVWKVLSQSPTTLTLGLRLGDAQNHPLIALTKTFTINPATYDVNVSHQVQNLSDHPLTVAINQVAAIDLPRDNIQGDDRSYDGATLDVAKKIITAPVDLQFHTGLTKFAGSAHEMGAFSGSTPLLWTAASNRFFVAITRPQPTPSAAASFQFTLEDGRKIELTNHVASASLDAYVLPSAAGLPAGTTPDLLAVIRFSGAAMKIDPGASIDMPLTSYLGPKQRTILAGDRTAAVGTDAYNYEIYQYYRNIRFSQGGFCSACTFDWLAYLILRLLDFLHATVAFHNYGVAIMLLVLVVRAILHPLTRASQINMAVMGKRMKEIQPLLEASKKKYAKDSKKQSEEQLRIYRENNVNPAGPLLGCLPMLLQTPIWIALYAGLRVDIDLRHAAFIPGWINDLSNPDTILPHPIPPMGHPLFHLPLLGDIYGLNLLPILLVAVYYFNMKAMAASQPVATDPNQAQMQAMSKYMIFLFPIFLYNAPSGLNLYIFASTLGGLVDTYFIRRTLKARGILPQSASDVATPNPLV